MSRTSRDEGFSLPELIVTMAILGIVTTIMVGMTVAVSRSFTQDRAANDSTMVAAAGMKEVTRVVRSGSELVVSGSGTSTVPVFVEAAANSITFYAYIDTDSASPKPVRVRFSIDSQRRLVETRWAATSTSSPWTFAAWTNPTQVRTIARSIPVGSTPLFSYLNEAGNAITEPTGGYTEADLRLIRAVQVTLTVQADETARADPVMMQSAVGIPNLGKPRVRS